jgi:hypothetical protein
MIADKLLSLQEGEFVFALTRDDLGPLFADRAGVAHSALSPFVEVLRDYAPGSGGLTPQTAELLADPEFAPLVDTLAAPQLLIRQRLGGGSASFDEMRVCASPTTAERLLAVAVTDDGGYLVRVFEGPGAFVAWWMESLAGRNEETIANYVPPRLDLGAFLLILHTVDMFRRVSYQRALNFDYESTVSVPVADFAPLMSRALQSRDLRWLLPTFVAVTPNLADVVPEIRPEHSQALADLAFLRNAKDAQTGEDILLFGEAGQSMGVEFMRSWFLAAGFEFSVAGQGAQKELPRLFIAPTALANHFVRLEMSPEGGCTVNHQAYTYPQLEVKLQEILERAYALCARPAPQPEAAPPPPEATAPPTTAPAQVLCPHCGEMVDANMRFCVHCGGRVSAA